MNSSVLQIPHKSGHAILDVFHPGVSIDEDFRTQIDGERIKKTKLKMEDGRIVMTVVDQNDKEIDVGYCMALLMEGVLTVCDKKSAEMHGFAEATFG